MTDSVRLTRRGFLAASGAAAAVGLIGCGDAGMAPPADPEPVDRTKAYLLTGAGRRVSNAAQSHNHSMRFVSAGAADGCRAHPGDNSRIVTIDVSVHQWMDWFASGATKVDLRHI